MPMYLRYQREKEAEQEMEDMHKSFARRPRKQALSAIIEKIVMVSTTCLPGANIVNRGGATTASGAESKVP